MFPFYHQAKGRTSHSFFTSLSQNSMHRFAKVAMLVLLTAGMLNVRAQIASCPVPVFSPASNFGSSTGTSPYAITTGDFNGDGNADLATANSSSDNALVLLGDGSGSFGSPAILVTGDNPRSITTGDFNGDSRLDLATSNTGDNNVSVFLGDGSGSFGPPTNFTTNFPEAITTGDFNADDKLDLATCDPVSDNVSVFLGDGNGSFGPATNFPIGDAAVSIIAVDLNGDASLELVTANNSLDRVQVLLNTGSGSFGPASDFAVGDRPQTVTSGDFNGDGNVDLATANGNSDNVSVLLGDGSGGFVPAVNFVAGNSPVGITSGDFNGDGYLDLATSNSSSDNVSVLLGDGSGSFGPAVNFAAGDNSRSITTGDFNGDGRLDLATANNFSDDVSVLLNACKSNPDEDGDGVLNDIDNCPTTANANQLDTDNDGQGDVCDMDDDGDGDADVSDCAPSDPAIYHGATEVCNGKDDNCDGYVDEGVQTTYYKDADKDGYGNKNCPVKACSMPAGYVTNSTDCNDNDGTIYPGAPELCDYKDNDCDGKTDEYLTKKTYYKDHDKDGYGDYRECKTACTAPYGYVAKGGDCNDRNNKVYPYAKELCDGLDNDCDGKIDEYLTKKNFYRDYDCDGYGDKNKCIVACAAPPGYVSDKRDCDDYNKNVHPYAKEICDGLDNDCDGKTDEGFTTKSYYRDYDKDGYGDPKECKVACSAPSGYVTNNKDCNDRNKKVNPECKEIAGNKTDDNCNGKVDESSSYASRGANDKEIYQQAIKGLKVKVLPNPSPNHFTLNLKGGSDKPMQLRVVDITGRLVEIKSNIAASSTVTIGNSYQPGVYFVEVTQGIERLVIKCIKQ